MYYLESSHRHIHQETDRTCEPMLAWTLAPPGVDSRRLVSPLQKLPAARASFCVRATSSYGGSISGQVGCPLRTEAISICDAEFQHLYQRWHQLCKLRHLQTGMPTSSSLSSWLACHFVRDDFAFVFVTPRGPPCGTSYQ